MSRSRKALITILVGHLLLVFSAVSMAQNASKDFIDGRVLNKTLDSKGVAGLEVVLLRVAEDKSQEVGLTKSNSSGYFSFKDITIDKDSTYFIATRYKGVEYTTPEIAFKDGKAPASEMFVYELTDQDEAIHTKMHHIFMETGEDSLEVQELIILENLGDRVYVGSQEVEPGRRETLRISLPKGANGVRHMGTGRAFTAGDDLVGTADIKPGAKRVIIAYTINPEDSPYVFAKRFNLKTDNVDLAFPDGGVTFESDQLELRGPTENSGRRFFHLAGKDFAEGSQIFVEISGLSGPKKLFRWIIAGLLILLITTGFTLAFMKRGTYLEEEDDLTVAEKTADLTEERQAMLRAIAELDDLSESGQVNAEEYQRERAQLLQKVKELMRSESSDDDK